jgi:3-oxoacyl-[acyl-carrier-protein] synthase-3
MKMNLLNNVIISGVGHYIPLKTLDNDKLSSYLNVSNEWILERSGIKTRRIAFEDETSSQMAFYASLNCMEDSNTDPNEIDMIICSTFTPDYPTPSTANIIQNKLNITNNCLCFDISSGCAGFIIALSIAYNFIQNGTCSKILVVAADILSKYTDYNDKSTCILFGDGAGAILLEKSEKSNSFYYFKLGSDSLNYDFIKVDKNYLRLKGKDVFKWAITKVPQIIKECLEISKIDKNNIDYFILHQANKRINSAISKKLEIPEDKFLSNIENYGNTSSASIPILLSESYRRGIIKKNNKILLCGFGSGLSWGCSIIEWNK